MKNIIFFALLVLAITNVSAAPKGSYGDPLYVVNIATEINVTGDVDIDGNTYMGPDNWVSTMNANGTFTIKSGVATTTAAFSAEVSAGSTTINGAFYSGTRLFAGQVSTISANGAADLVSLNVVGGITAGAVNFVSTFTASTGAWNIAGPIVMGRDNAKSTMTAAGALSLNGALDVVGNAVMGAANYRSTFTASSGALALSGALTANASVSVGTSFSVTGQTSVSSATLTGGLLLSARTIAQLDAMAPSPLSAGVIYLCSDCIADNKGIALAISSGTGVGAFVSVSSTSQHVGTTW